MLMFYQNVLSTEDSGLTLHSKTETVAAGFKIKIFSTETFSLWGCWCIKTFVYSPWRCLPGFLWCLSFHRLVSGMAEHEVSLDEERNKTSPCFLPFFPPVLSPFACLLHCLTSTVQAKLGLISTSSGRSLWSIPACPVPPATPPHLGTPRPAAPCSAPGSPSLPPRLMPLPSLAMDLPRKSSVSLAPSNPSLHGPRMVALHLGRRRGQH